MSLYNNSVQSGFMQSVADSMTPKFAISYLRVSTQGQAERGGGADEGFSIPAQREANKRKAHSLGAFIGKEFVDRGASARSAARPELQKMLEYIRENRERVDYVIVHKVDRLARNRGDDIDITRALQEADVQLVSACESIDDTPAGMLLHGIMSSIAEFYSRNLSTEVKKGISEKVKAGGTPSLAPLGYRNIRGYDERGRRDSHVEIDQERAPLIKLAFEEYATGNWSLRALAEYISELGLTTPATRKLPSRPLNKKKLDNLFNNPYYKGIVTYNGAVYPGKHEPIVDEALWDKVQEILGSHVNGERERIHDHYLKSTVYCGQCGSRLIIHNAKSRSGARYPYFVCLSKHNKSNGCRQRSLLIDEIADKIEQLYDRISFTPEFRSLVHQWVLSQIHKLTEDSQKKQDSLKKQKDKLEREQQKLLQAHYADAIPLQLLKDEQARIAKTLKGIANQMAAYQSEYQLAEKNIQDAFELLEDCGKAYRLANDYQRRCFNQALFKKILVSEDLTLDTQYREPFDEILVPGMLILKGEVEKCVQNVKDEQSKSTAHLSFLESIKLANTQTIDYFFTAGLSMNHLVHRSRINPNPPPRQASQF